MDALLYFLQAVVSQCCLFHADPDCLAATTLAFATSTLYHYILCNRFVFDSGSRYHRGTEVSLVFLVSAIGLGWNLLLMWLFTSPAILGLNPMVSKIMASAIVTVWNYVSRKKWIFK
jgi:putative flippase GtrA